MQWKLLTLFVAWGGGIECNFGPKNDKTILSNKSEDLF